MARHGVDFLAAHLLHVEDELAVVQEKHVARAHVARQLLVVEPDAPGIAHRARRVEDERVARLERNLAVGEFPDTDFRPLQVRHDAHRAPDLAARDAHHLGARHVVVGRAVGKIQAHDVDARGEHPLEDLGRARRGPECRDDLRAARGARLRSERHHARALSSRIVTAGSVLPSRNSRKAPPPVEM